MTAWSGDGQASGKPDTFRVSCKAIIVEDDRLLAIHLRDDATEFFYLPGGGQEFGETVEEALERECREEIGCGVVTRELLFVRDYFGWAHEFSHIEGHIHQVELMFLCDIRPGERPTTTQVPDAMQIGYVWLPLDDLLDARFYPLGMREDLVQAVRQNDPPPARYLGAMN